MLTTVFLCTWLLAADGDVKVSPEASADFVKQTEKLVRQLGDPEVAARDSAEQGLLKLGAGVLPLLPQGNLTGEKKERVERIRNTLERTAVESSAQASKVTLAGELSLADALAAIEKQTGVKVNLAGAKADTKLTLAIRDRPFWEAFDELVDLADLAVAGRGEDEGGLQLMARAEGQAARKARAAYSGVFRFEPIRVTAVRDLRHRQIEGLRLALEVAWEPRVHPIVIDLPLTSVKALDAKGKALEIEGRAGSLGIAAEGNTRSAAEIELPLHLPDRDVRRIASLQGTLSTLLPGKIETFTFEKLDEAPDKTKDREQRRAGVSVGVEKAFKNADLYELRMHVRFDDAANALESHRNWIDRNEAYLLDADGKRVEPAGYESGARKANEQQMSFIFPLEKGFAGCKFVYKTPALLVKMSVPFEVKDIDLP